MAWWASYSDSDAAVAESGANAHSSAVAARARLNTSRYWSVESAARIDALVDLEAFLVELLGQLANGSSLGHVPRDAGGEGAERLVGARVGKPRAVGGQAGGGEDGGAATAVVGRGQRVGKLRGHETEAVAHRGCFGGVARCAPDSSTASAQSSHIGRPAATVIGVSPCSRMKSMTSSSAWPVPDAISSPGWIPSRTPRR